MLKIGTLLLTFFLAFPTHSQTLDPIQEVVTSTETFAVCKAVDVASTIYLLSHGLGVEANPVVAWTISVGGYVPLIAASVGLYYLLKHFDNPAATGAANIITCGVAAHNLLLMP